MIQTDRFLIKRASSDDAKSVAALRGTPSTYSQLTDPSWYSPEDTAKWLSNLPKGSARWKVEDACSHELIGLVRLDNIDHINQTCMIGLDIVEGQRGQGLGAAVYKAVLDYLAGYWNMELVYLYVLETNPAKNLYDRLGFEQTGRIPGAVLRQGTRRDYILMVKKLGV